MKKKILSLTLVLVLILSLVPVVPVVAAAPGTYNLGDIAAINAIITNNGLDVPLAPADGSSVPAEWGTLQGGHSVFQVRWWYSRADEPNQRVSQLYIRNYNITTLDVSGLTELGILDLTNNRLTSLDVSNNTKLRRLELNSNPWKHLM